MDGKFEIGAGQSAGGFPDALNLIPLTSSDEPHLCEPFIQTVVNDNGKKKVVTTFLQPNSFPDGIPAYNLDAQDLDGDGMMDDQIPLGTLVTVVLNAIPDPVSGKCVGVRTTIQHRVGTCKLWITRKFYNTCSTPKRITHVKEMVGPQNPGIAGATAGPGKSTVVVHQSNGELLTLATANTGAKVTAGSVDFFDTFFQESESCLTTASFTTQQVFGARILELFLDYTPGGVLLKRAGALGSEKLLTYHLDIQ